MALNNYRKRRKKRRFLLPAVELSGYRGRRPSKKGYQKKRKKGLAKALIVVMMVLVCLAAAGSGTFFYLRESGKRSLMAVAVTEQPDLGSGQDDSGLVSRNGKKYTYNTDNINILCMGIDRNTSLTEEEEEVGDAGQADTILLLSLNPEEATMKIVGISRDTMTKVRTYDRQGSYLGKSTNHLGLAYSFGDGAATSCELVMEAVSSLFYDLPIHGYAAVNMNSIGKLNDAVGGVTVTLPEDMKLAGEDFSSGISLKLDGDQAESFVRTRDMEKGGSNNLRMERQKQYAVSFVGAAAGTIKRNPTVIAELYGALTEDMVTSIGVDEAVYLGSLLPGIQFSADNIQMLQGTTKQGAVYEEFYVDEEALMDTVLEVFYREVDGRP